MFRFAEIGKHERPDGEGLPSALRYPGSRTDAPLEVEAGHAPPGPDTPLHEFAGSRGTRFDILFFSYGKGLNVV